MLRSLVHTAFRLAPATFLNASKPAVQVANLSFLHAKVPTVINLLPRPNQVLLPANQLLTNAPLLQQQTTRTVTKFTLNKGKRRTVRAVIKRFKRLDWGIWIRTHCGRHKKMFKKSPALKRRLRQHIFTNASQSRLLDKMVTSFWRRPKHYIDDPYAPYHKRDEYFATKSKTFAV